MDTATREKLFKGFEELTDYFDDKATLADVCKLSINQWMTASTQARV
jgi:hypothetical protein